MAFVNANTSSIDLESQHSPTTKGYTLSWSNLTYTINTSEGKKQILSNLHGILEPGTVTAVIGASGAGKSSFLDVLAGRISPSLISGTVAINGSSSIPMKHASRYCTQEEALFSNLTVFETLLYSAHFNLPKAISISMKKNIVMNLIMEFGLESVSSTIIGGPLIKGCSGGQRRRVSVASQCIGIESGILYLDEPTSGLDSVAAEAMISSVSNLAKNHGCTVIATIHQPSTQTFEMFSHILLLGAGSTVYFGPRIDSMTYFESIGHQIPTHMNPSDVYLQLTNIDFDSQEEVGKLRVDYLISTFAKSQQSSSILRHIALIKSQRERCINGDVNNPSHTNGFLYQTQILMSRAFMNAAKNPLAYWIRVFMYIALAILMGTTWTRMSLDQSSIQNRMAGLFFTEAFLSFMAVAGIPAFLEERLVFVRECANGLYSVESYVLSNLIVSIPFVFLIAMGFSSIAYFSMGLQESGEKFLIFVAILFTSLMIAEAQTVFVSVTIPIFVAAMAITAFANGVWLIVQGFFVPKKNITDFWRYSFHQIDFQKYAYELFVSNEMSGLSFDCKMNGTAAGECQCVIEPFYSNSTCSIDGKDVLKYYDYQDISYCTWWIILLVIFVFFKLSTYVMLKISMNKCK